MGRLKYAFVSTFSCLDDKLLKEKNPPNEKVDDRTRLGDPRGWALPSRPYALMSTEDETNAIYKPIQSKESQMQNHNAVTKIKRREEEKLERNWRHKLKIADIELKNAITERLFSFGPMEDDHLALLDIAKHLV